MKDSAVGADGEKGATAASAAVPADGSGVNLDFGGVGSLFWSMAWDDGHGKSPFTLTKVQPHMRMCPVTGLLIKLLIKLPDYLSSERRALSRFLLVTADRPVQTRHQHMMLNLLDDVGRHHTLTSAMGCISYQQHR